MVPTLIRMLTVLLICLVVSACATDGANQNNIKLREIEHLWQSVPIYPGMVEVNRSSSSSGSEARVSRRYQSDAYFAEVRRLYLEQLAQAGWQLVAHREVKDRGRIRVEREFDFRRGEFYLDMRYAGARRD